MVLFCINKVTGKGEAFNFQVYQDIVWIDKVNLDPHLKYCSRVTSGKKFSNMIPKIACYDIEDDGTKLVEVYEIYDEPFDIKKIKDIKMENLMIPSYNTTIVGPNKQVVEELKTKADSEPDKFNYSFESSIQNIFFSEQKNDSLIILVQVVFVL